MTVKELMEKLKEFPEDMKVINYDYLDIQKIYKDTFVYPCSGYKEECVVVE